MRPVADDSQLLEGLIGADLIAQIKSSSGGAKPLDQSARSKSQDLRTIGLGAQILADIGVRKMRVLSAPKRIHSSPNPD